MVARPSLRRFLQTVGVAAGTSVLRSAVLSGVPLHPHASGRSVGRDETLNRDRHTVLMVTNYKTEVYMIEAANLSLTVFVIGGMQGDERTGIYRIDGIGQAILPTDETIVHATNAVEYVNENYLFRRPDLTHHEMQGGITIPEDRAALIHKASADQDMEGWLTGIPRIGPDLHEQTFLHDVVAQALLREVDVEVTSEKVLSDPF